jgi:HD-GYP domain-containing protein (c-di-GMP phosphodiesterase class II)
VAKLTSKKLLVPINELKEGMISASDIHVRNSILLGKGITITEEVITKLKKIIIIDKIEIHAGDFSQKTLQPISPKAKELENTFNSFAYSLETIFNTISKQKFVEMEQLRIFSKKIREELILTDRVIKNIIFFGSGNNNIYRHSVNVAAISFILGKWLGLKEKEVNFLTYSALLHDFGKITMDNRIANNTDYLTNSEYKLFKSHPVIGYNFVKNIPFLDSSVGYGVLMHHERIDGTGYPLGIKNSKIHKFAKIIAIADLFDEICSNKYHKKINGPFDALAIIKQESLGKLDCYYSSMFLNHITNNYMGETVILNNKRTCKVIKFDMKDLSKPLLLDERGLLDLKEEKDLYIEKIVI